MSEIKKIKVSELTEVENPKGMDFSIFGYRISNKRHESIQVPWDSLIKVVEDAARSVQLERRIIVAFERPEQLVPIGEKMEVYDLVTRNITKLEYRENRPDDLEWKVLDKGTLFSGEYDVILKINSDQEGVTGYECGVSTSYEKYSTVTIFAKKINKEETKK